MLRGADDFGAFDGFGPTWLAADAALPATELALPADRTGARNALRHECPLSPGVYGMIDADGQLIYVGKSKQLRDRLLSYFAGPSADPKARRIMAYTKHLLWETAPHEFVALLRELELIRRWCPKYNVRGRPGRERRAYVGVGRGDAPGVYITDQPARRDEFVLGPFPPGRNLERMVRSLNDCLKLRDCPERTPIHFAEQRELFGQEYTPRCLRHALGTCLGPCAAACTQREYAAQVRAAKAFLRGTDRTIVGRMEQAMLAASAAAQYEQAATLRDTWKDLCDLRDVADRLTKVRREYSFVYPLPSYTGGGESWYVVHRGQVMAVIPAPRNRRTAAKALRTLEQVYPDSRAEAWPPAADDPDLILLVSLWFRANPEEMARTLSVDAARRACARPNPANAECQKANGETAR